jgi:hypothetical protein
MNDDYLLQMLRDKCTIGNILYILPCKNIGISRCTIAVIDNLESAERLCVELNKREGNNINLKVIISNLGSHAS